MGLIVSHGINLTALLDEDIGFLTQLVKPENELDSNSGRSAGKYLLAPIPIVYRILLQVYHNSTLKVEFQVTYVLIIK